MPSPVLDCCNSVAIVRLHRQDGEIGLQAADHARDVAAVGNGPAEHGGAAEIRRPATLRGSACAGAPAHRPAAGVGRPADLDHHFIGD